MKDDLVKRLIACGAMPANCLTWKLILDPHQPAKVACTILVKDEVLEEIVKAFEGGASEEFVRTVEGLISWSEKKLRFTVGNA